MPILHDEDGQDNDTLWRRIRYGAISFMLMVILLAGMAPTPTYAHGGGLAADGCHYDRKAGTRHCHGGARPAPASPSRQEEAESTIPTVQRPETQERHR